MKDCIEKHTHREYVTSIAWLDEQLNIPDKSEYYLMRIAQRIQQVLRKDPNKITIEQQKIEFKTKKLTKKSKARHRQTRIQMSKARWMSALTGVNKHGNG